MFISIEVKKFGKTGTWRQEKEIVNNSQKVANLDFVNEPLLNLAW